METGSSLSLSFSIHEHVSRFRKCTDQSDLCSINGQNVVINNSGQSSSTHGYHSGVGSPTFAAVGNTQKFPFATPISFGLKLILNSCFYF